MADIYIISGQINSPGGLGDQAYLGLTNRTAIERIKEHFYKLDKGSHPNPIVQQYYSQFGRGAFVTGVIVSAPDYYVNSLEKVYIDRLQTFTGENPCGWNRSKGGEGGIRFNQTFALKKDGQTHYGTDLYLFLMQHSDLNPDKLVELLEGKTASWNGWEKA